MILTTTERKATTMTDAFPLGLLGPGEQALIVLRRDNPGRACEGRSEDMGLHAGKVVEMLANSGGGPLLLKVDESRLAIGRRIAMKILVRRQR